MAAFPTDTVTGLGCRADLAAAVAAVFEIKGRDSRRPLVLFVDELGAVERYAGPLSPRVTAVLKRCWPGALTAVLPLAVDVPDGVGRGRTVGVRVPAHSVPLALLRALGTALATTSANLSGRAPLRAAEEAERAWPGRVRALPGESGSVPSTVADFTVWPPRILREGSVTAGFLMGMAKEAEEE